MPNLSATDANFLRMAYEEALTGFNEGGCPIGAVLVDNVSGRVLGEGHNGLVQEGNPIIHGEMAALRNAGRMKNRHNTTMYTTLQPCFMCTGAIVQFGIPRVVIGDQYAELLRCRHTRRPRHEYPRERAQPPRHS